MVKNFNCGVDPRNFQIFGWGGGGVEKFWGVWRWIEKFSGGGGEGLRNFRGWVEKFSGGLRNFRGGVKKFSMGGLRNFRGAGRGEKFQGG